MWFYFITMSFGISVALGWFALLDWHNKRQWERYHRQRVRRGRNTAERGVYSKQKPVPETTRAGMVKPPGRVDTKQ